MNNSWLISIANINSFNSNTEPLPQFPTQFQLVGRMNISLTPEEARVGDLAKACVEIKFILFIEKSDLVSYIESLICFIRWV